MGTTRPDRDSPRRKPEFSASPADPGRHTPDSPVAPSRFARRQLTTAQRSAAEEIDSRAAAIRAAMPDVGIQESVDIAAEELGF
jgi:hypothetical protein